jgi:toxin FitB
VIILDTNAISEFMLPQPDPQVLRWLDLQPAPSLWTTANNLYEIRFGLESMPEGRRRSGVTSLFERWLSEVLQQRIVVFDAAAAECAAKLNAARKAQGRLVDSRDTMIAGIVLANHAMLATRNLKHFEDIAKWVVNPWKA